MLVKAHGVTRNHKSYLEASEDWLLTLRNKATSEARSELLKLMGVGRKVADCVLLMSLDKVRYSPFHLLSIPSTRNIIDSIYGRMRLYPWIRMSNR